MPDRSDNSEQQPSPASWFRRAEWVHKVWLGAGFLYAIGHLFLFRGADLRITVMFVLPPLYACATLGSHDSSRVAKAIASLFLLCVGFAVLIGNQPALLPGVRGFPRLPLGLPLIQDRILTLYAVVYWIFLVLVIPPCVMIKVIRRKAERQTFKALCGFGMILWVLAALAMILGGIAWLLE